MIISYLIKSLIFVQPFLWIYLLGFNNNYVDRLFKYLQYLFYVIGFGFCLFVYLNNIHFEFYTEELLITYSFFVMITTFMFQSYYYNPRQSICMGFLITYFNSFYWESMLHIVAFISGGVMNTLYQASIHLLPLPFLLNKWIFLDNKKAIKLILYGLIVSAILVEIRAILQVFNLDEVYHILNLNQFNRYSSLAFLIVAFRKPTN